MITFNYDNKQITTLELLEILKNKHDPFSYKELAEYKSIIDKASIELREVN